ncbi:hypothetical protein [Paraflavitalea sp. CAU 1676]|uniref:hypothetical protein n=1 Tax=Paraflavitalea sp. CAU 1676 TaxID=3032598 RepID=UPI0023DC6DF2|nr:hypothetical protein [Paraflavitalea sp. CAU 1676]MDF2189068.1 hypothetical protein [Paraflavitalea sp. CAU 1676]
MRAVLMSLFTGLFMLVLTGCNEHAEEYRRAALEKTFRSIGEEMRSASASSFRFLENKWFDPSQRMKAEVWFDRGKLVKATGHEACTYLDSLEAALRKEVGTTETLFDDGVLYDRLLQYKHRMLSTMQPSLYRENPTFAEVLLRDSLGFTVHGPLLPADSTIDPSSRKMKWVRDHAGDHRKETTLLLLANMKADVLAMQAQLIEYLGNQIGATDGWFFATAICDISANQIKKGQPLTVFLGYGYRNYHSSERVFIQDSITRRESWDWATRKVRVTGLPGKYSIPVRFEYEENGLIKTATRQLEYEIVP